MLDGASLPSLSIPMAACLCLCVCMAFVFSCVFLRARSRGAVLLIEDRAFGGCVGLCERVIHIGDANVYLIYLTFLLPPILPPPSRSPPVCWCVRACVPSSFSRSVHCAVSLGADDLPGGLVGLRERMAQMGHFANHTDSEYSSEVELSGRTHCTSAAAPVPPAPCLAPRQHQGDILQEDKENGHRRKKPKPRESQTLKEASADGGGETASRDKKVVAGRRNDHAEPNVLGLRLSRCAFPLVYARGCASFPISIF